MATAFFLCDLLSSCPVSSSEKAKLEWMVYENLFNFHQCFLVVYFFQKYKVICTMWWVCNIMMILMVLPRIALRSKSQPELEWNGKMIGEIFYRRGKEGFYFYSYVTVRTKQPSEGFLEDVWSGKRGKEEDAANKRRTKKWSKDTSQ